MESSKPIRVRMAPSPTGFLHIGTARTTLFNWLFARKAGGVFVLRIEDTDEERSKPEYEKSLIEGLHWLGLAWDEGPDFDEQGRLISKGDLGPYRQSERREIYRKYLEELLASGKAYYCYCTKEELEAQRQSMLADGLPSKYSGRCRNLTSPPADSSPEAIRFAVPEKKVKFQDLIRGGVEFDTALFGDIIIAKDLNSPLYNFAVVVDDELMKISHVIRGEDHISNTPKQILIQEALGFAEPHYAHIPLILNPDRSKLSKRKNKVSIADYRAEGYLPEAMLNFLALLGWHPSHNEEFFTGEELIKEFDLERVQKSGAVFDLRKLDWINAHYIKETPDEKLAGLVRTYLPKPVPEPDLLPLVRIAKERMTKLSEFPELVEFYFELPDYEPSLLNWKGSDVAQIAASLEETKRIVEECSEDMIRNRDALLAALNSNIQKSDRGTVLWPFRVALSGQKNSPDPLLMASVLGKVETLRRLDTALHKLNP